MGHEQFTRRLHLLALDEMEGPERRLLEEHLRTCAACRAELQRLQSMLTVVRDHAPGLQVHEGMLQEARQQLRAALRQERMRRTAAERAGEWLAGLFAPGARLALGALATLAVGFLAGRTLFPARPADAPGTAEAAPGDTRITNVRFLDSGAGTGSVEFTFDAVRPVRMKGSINDPQVQKVLTYAMLNDENPGVRLRAVSAMAAPAVPQPDREIRSALIVALRTDPNAGVRKEALTALLRLPPDTDVKNALLNTLMTDRNPGLRIAAINAFDSLRTRGEQADQAVLRALQAKMHSDDNTYIRLRAKTVLQETREKEVREQ
ncbi:MAG TPA: HEAT repeat domain-containing protein [Bacteroidota bacterium]